MEAKWIAKNGSEQLIIFFCGWGFDEQCVSRIAANDVDVVVMYDYRSLEVELVTDGYQHVTVIAWSFGVWVASKLMHDGAIAPNEAYAINGSLLPVHNEEGIPTKIFEGTLAGLSETTIGKFNMRICGGARQHAELSDLLPNRSFDGQLEELSILGKYFATSPISDKDRWTKALIATNDLIFPSKNLQNHWGSKAVTIDGAHLCFGGVRSWNEMLEMLADNSQEALNVSITNHDARITNTKR